MIWSQYNEGQILAVLSVITGVRLGWLCDEEGHGKTDKPSEAEEGEMWLSGPGSRSS